MLNEKIKEVVDTYKKWFKSWDVPAKEATKKKYVDQEEVLPHCHSMLPKIEEFINEGRREKAFRWLGFVQGCLWVMKIYKLEELKNHNRPDKQ